MLKFINDTALVFLLKVLKEFITYKEKDGGISSVAEISSQNCIYFENTANITIPKRVARRYSTPARLHL